MTFVFYRSLIDGWRIGVADNPLEGTNVSVHDGEIEETVAMSDIYIPQLSCGEGDADALLHMEHHPSVFLQKRDAALMSPTPLVGIAPLVQLLRHRASNDEFTTDIGDNFSLLLGKGGPLDVNPPAHNTISKAVLAWRGSQQRQVVVSCGEARPALFGNLLAACCKLLGATQAQREVLLAGMNVLSAFTTTVGQKQLCYLRANVFAKAKNGKEEAEEFQGIRVECDHLFTSGIGCKNDSNFKIFSYVLYGISDMERDELFINRKQREFVCQKSIKDEKLVLRLQEEYLMFTDAMQTIGISPATQQTLLRQVAIIIHLTEIEFYADGSLANSPALKNVARLCQLDVEECRNVFSSLETCAVTARFLYDAILILVLKKINGAFGYIGDLTSLHSCLTLLAVPPPSFVESVEKDISRLVLAAIYEGMLQTFIVSSDQELTQLQGAGLHVPEKLQAALEKFDNYCLLKVLYGVGGVLSVARGTHGPDQLIPALTNCAKSGYVTFDANTMVLTIEHFFGTRHYQFPRNSGEISQLRTIHHADFESLRSFFIEKADADTREALQLFGQTEGGAADQIIALEMLHVKPLLETLQDRKSIFWWIGNIGLGAGFDANSVEKQLRELPVFCAMELRRHLPYRYVMCRSAFVASTFKSLLPPENKVPTENTQQIAEAILCFLGANWCAKGDDFFVSGDSLAEMTLRAKEQLCQKATIIQAFARTYFCGATLKRRVAALLDMFENVEKRRNNITETCCREFQIRNFCQWQLLNLMEKESAARSTILEECLKETTALKEMFHKKNLEGVLARNLALSFNKEKKYLNSVVENNQKGKFQMIIAHIRQRLKEQRAHLDGVVEKQLDKKECQRYAQKLEKIHKNLLTASLQKEERRNELNAARERREAKLSAWQKRRRQEAEEKREKMSRCRSQGHIFRKQLCQAQDEFYDALAAQMAVRDVEGRVLRCVKDEIVSFRRQENARLLLKQRGERQRMEAAVTRAAKANEQKAAQQELRERRAAEEEQLRRRRVGWERLGVQRRQRQVAERRRSEITRAVSAALPRFAAPVLYDHRPHRRARRSCSCSGGPPEEFVLAGGRKIYSRMLSESLLRGLFEFHATKPRAKSPYSRFTVGQKLSSSL